MLAKLLPAGLRINAEESNLCIDTSEYLEYLLTHEGHEAQSYKILVILVLKPPKAVKQLQAVLVLIQHKCDTWSERSEVLVPFMDLVGECSHTKVTKKQGTNKNKFHWHPVHQQVFEQMKQLLSAILP